MQLSTAARNRRLDAYTTEIGNAGLLRIYTGAAPADVASAATGTKLSEHTLGSPFAPAAAAAVLSPTLPANVNALATGTAGYWRIYKADAASCVLQGTVGTAGAEMILNSTAIVSGGPVQVNSFSISEGGG